MIGINHHHRSRRKVRAFVQTISLWIFLLLTALQGSGAANRNRLYLKAKDASYSFTKRISEKGLPRFKFDTLKMEANGAVLRLEMSASFAEIPFRTESVNKYYADYRQILGRKFRKSKLIISSMGKEISELIPNSYRDKGQQIDSSRLSVPKKTREPIVCNTSKNDHFVNGLANRNIALWHSHGWYYENTLDRWEWQRARDFLTVEDLWTLSFVVPYITPMLENAGATVWLPRERDLGTKELIVDAEKSSAGSEYIETGLGWKTSANAGYELKYPFLLDGENPFRFGHARSVSADNQISATVKYLPQFPETKEYAVYVSYVQDDQNVSDAHYSVFHAGGRTDFTVNQSMGGGTWIYLGTFLFEKGKNPGKGSIELSNWSREKGKVVSADAVRFGGGNGNIVRGKSEQLKKLYDLRESEGFDADSAKWIPFTSQRPRYQEGARYYLQYAGFPDSLVYCLNRTKVDYSNRGSEAVAFAKKESGMEDYKDDYMSRGEFVNYLMGDPSGPTKAPHAKGLGIPVDLSMAFHTDAGTTADSSIIGSLVIYDTTFERDTFVDGQSKWASRDLADLVQTQVVNDLRALHKADWTRRGMWNKRYFEAARPKVPAILSELLSHQNFADMYLAQDPRFKFDVSRAFYKGILKFLAFQNGYAYKVQPLPVNYFAMKLNGNELKLSWQPVEDPLEPTATPTAYKLYRRVEDGGFDNGIVVREPSIALSDLQPGKIYSFKVTAFNEGGESFPSEILACSLPEDNQKPVLIVNGFDRICAPAAFDNGKEAGFRMSEDEGVAYQQNLAYIGEQYDFDRQSPWLDDDACGFGSSYGDQETRIMPGNSFNYPYVHGKAFRNNKLGFISTSDEAFEKGGYDPAKFTLLDLLFGEEKSTKRLIGIPGRDFTLFTPAMREAIRSFSLAEGAKIVVSGAYVGTDLALCGDSLARKFAAEVLHYTHRTGHASKSGQIYTVNRLNERYPGSYPYVKDWHPSIYKVESPDAIEPAGNDAVVLYRYFGDNKSAGVWYNGNYKTVVLGIPIETISDDGARDRFIGQIKQLMDIK